MRDSCRFQLGHVGPLKRFRPALALLLPLVSAAAIFMFQSFLANQCFIQSDCSWARSRSRRSKRFSQRRMKASFCVICSFPERCLRQCVLQTLHLETLEIPSGCKAASNLATRLRALCSAVLGSGPRSLVISGDCFFGWRSLSMGCDLRIGTLSCCASSDVLALVRTAFC